MKVVHHTQAKETTRALETVLYSRKSEMGNLGSDKLWENPALVQSSLVDWSLGLFRAEQCFRNDFRSFPNQLRLGIK